MDPLTLIAYIEAAIAAIGQGITDVETAWTAVAGMVSAKRDPTAAEWSALNASADAAHVAVQAP